MAKVGQKKIDYLLDNSVVKTQTIFGKCTLVTVQLPNGFIITESSACVDPDNYDEKAGREICLKRIENKLWELEGYRLQEAEHQKYLKEKRAAEAKRLEDLKKKRNEEIERLKNSANINKKAIVKSNNYMSGVGLHSFPRGTVVTILKESVNNMGQTYFHCKAVGTNNDADTWCVPYWDLQIKESKNFDPGDEVRITGNTGKEVVGSHPFRIGEEAYVLNKYKHLGSDKEYYQVRNPRKGIWYVLGADLEKVGGNN